MRTMLFQATYARVVPPRCLLRRRLLVRDVGVGDDFPKVAVGALEVEAASAVPATGLVVRIPLPPQRATQMRAAIMIAALATAGCTYQSAVSPTPVYDVYSGYDNKVPGTWGLFVADMDRFAGEAEPASISCAAHKYPVDVGTAFNTSVVATIGNLVEDMQIVDRALTVTEREDRGLEGMIVIRAESLQAEMIVNMGFWSGRPRSEVELVATLTVEGPKGRLVGTTVSGNATARTTGGCAKVADVVSKATEDAMEDLLTILGERLSNSPRIRDLR